ncbi:ATP-binding protein [Rhodococcus fascians]|nr:ATP-binding protein [Rhodococcus fascians]MBY3996316.1 ATP-binding protein [Rhodococcus fascians]MBY4002969.1 ATP-binding protein [Rhodococcus fascians]MBY4007719.1 ATP-binding protein [Rhodococcus fascians]MBY4017528.1 ATP-binding protein [Rhodococcus fascians]
MADIIDNSLSADATEVRVRFEWAGADHSTISISDDGRGMSLEQLVRGMTVGGTGSQTGRESGDLGRFGMGLKTASFSQCNQLIVSTCTKGGQWATRTWDTDHVMAVGDWELIHGPPPDATNALHRLQSELTGGGTIVLWRKLTRLIRKDAPASDNSAKRDFFKKIREIELHLGMTFAQFIAATNTKIRILVNDNLVSSWDPFFSESPYVDRLPMERIGPGVSVQGYVMPHRNRLSEQEYEALGGPKGWIDQQGFYVYRENRLIVSGSWLDLGFKNDERHALARLRVDLSNAHDETWQIDIKKSKAVPPVSLQTPLKRLAKLTRERSQQTNTYRRSTDNKDRPREIPSTWLHEFNQGNIVFRLNRDHPLVSNALKRNEIPWLSSYLALIEQQIPLSVIRRVPDVDVSFAQSSGLSQQFSTENRDEMPESDRIPEVVLSLAKQFVASLVEQGITDESAIIRTVGMPPFNQYPRLSNVLIGGGDKTIANSSDKYRS